MISAMRQRVWVIAFERCEKPEGDYTTHNNPH